MPKPVFKPRYLTIQAGPAWLMYQFDRHLAAQGRSTSTRRTYGAAVARWLAVCGDPLAPTTDEVNAWLRQRRSTLTQASLNSELTALRRFYRWAHELDHTSTDHGRKFPQSRRLPPCVPRTLDRDQIEALLAAPDRDTFLGLRDYCVLVTLYECALTAAELVALTVDDVHHDNFLCIAARPHRPSRRVPFSTHLAETFKTYIEHRRAQRPGRHRRLFITRTGKPFAGAASVWDLVQRNVHGVLALDAGFERLQRAGIGPQRLRDSCAQHMLESGCDLRALQTFLGHASLNHTAKFERCDVTVMKCEHAKVFTHRSKSSAKTPKGEPDHE